MGYYSASLHLGDLIIGKDFWEIQHLFRPLAEYGEDLRYHRSGITVTEKNIDQYIDAWVKNFEKYTELEEEALKTYKSEGKEVTYNVNGLVGMTISIRANWTQAMGGVLICNNAPYPVSTKEELDEILRDYQTVKEKAETIQSKIGEIEKLMV